MPAVFVLMLLESMGILIPSEVISPFAGYLVSEGRMTLFAAVSAGVFGNLVGSWVAYFIGRRGGRELWFRYGRYVGVRAHHLGVAEEWFDRHGELAVFVSRCLPVVRTFIQLGENWGRIGDFLHYLDYAVALAFFAGVLYLLWRWRSSRAPKT